MLPHLCAHLIASVSDMGAFGKGKTPKQGSKGAKKGPGNGQPKPKARPPTLSEQHARKNKIITANQVQWKSIDIPDTLGDFSGLYGLEELDGIDVRMVDGKPEYIAVSEDEVDIDAMLDPKIKRAKKLREKREQRKKEQEERERGEVKEVKGKKGKKKEAGKGGKASEKEGPLPVLETEPEPEVEESDSEEPSVEASEESGLEEFTGFASDDEAEEVDTTTVLKTSQKPVEELQPNVFAALQQPLSTDAKLPEWEALGLTTYLLSALGSLGFKSPTEIQKQAIPKALNGKDVVGKATTGSGKTLAYGLPILESLAAQLGSGAEPTHISGLVFCPTRELAHQVVDHINAAAVHIPTEHTVVSVTGGLSIQKQERLLAKNPGVVVATPGRFLEVVEKNPELAKAMAQTDFLVLDEADRLLQDGHFDEFERILDLLRKTRTGRRWQTLVFSATFSRELFGKLAKPGARRQSSEGSDILELLNDKVKFRGKPELCDANPKEIVSGQVREAMVECGATERDLYLYYFLLNYEGLTLVFANSVDSVRRLVPFLTNLGVPAVALHLAMIQKQRLRAVEKFAAFSKAGKSTVLVATDVAARGLDIPNIDHVAHYHLPRLADVYVHRLGRTARAGKAGVAVMLCSPQEASGPLKKLRRLVAAEASSGGKHSHDVELIPVDLDVVQQIRERVRLAAKLADASVTQTATRKELLWITQAAEDLGIDNLLDLEGFEDDVLKKQRRRKEGKALGKDEQHAMRQALKQLLATPLRKNHRRSYITLGLENLAHQIVLGQTLTQILGKRLLLALDDLLSRKKQKAENGAKGKKQNGGKAGKAGRA